MSYTAPSVVASGINFATFQSTGRAAISKSSITAQTATVAPTVAATLSESGRRHAAGGDLLRGRHRVERVRRDDGAPASTGQAITLGQNLVVTFQSLKSGNMSRNTYIGTADRPVHARGERDDGLDCYDLGAAPGE